MKEIKKINGLSLAKIMGFLGLTIGLIADFAILLGITLTEQPFEFTSGAMLVILPLGYGVIYFLAGFLFGTLYNLIAKQVGGIKIEF